MTDHHAQNQKQNTSTSTFPCVINKKFQPSKFKGDVESQAFGNYGPPNLGGSQAMEFSKTLQRLDTSKSMAFRNLDRAQF